MDSYGRVRAVSPTATSVRKHKNVITRRDPKKRVGTAGVESRDTRESDGLSHYLRMGKSASTPMITMS